MADVMKIEILGDGTIKVETDRISSANHVNADEFVKLISKLAGGETTIKNKGRSIGVHSHSHDHEHEGHAH